jgi:hypothetical protein
MTKKWLWWTGGTLIVLVVGGGLAWNTAINYVLGSLAASSPPAKGEATSSGTISPDFGKEDSTAKNPTDLVTPSPSLDSNAERDQSGQGNSEVNPGSNTSSLNHKGGTPASGPSASQGSLGAPGEPSSSGTDSSSSGSNSSSSDPASAQPDKHGQDALAYTPNISEEKAQKVQDEISAKDKALVTSVLLKKLSPSDISLFMKLAGGGMTVEEKREAKKILLNKLTEEEYNELVAIAAKYGLSQGKSYAESKKQDLSARP